MVIEECLKAANAKLNMVMGQGRNKYSLALTLIKHQNRDSLIVSFRRYNAQQVPQPPKPKPESK